VQKKSALLMNKTVLNDKWIKASVTGTIWAASEIVFGSFLHNLKIPFCGNILTAIGLIILISTAYLWKEKGIFWRAGLICALMKTMSPSAVIFGPMIAILTEAIIVELSILLLGRTYVGFIIASILAMSWNLVQKVFSYILFYGFDIIHLYKDLVKIAEKQISYNFDLLWMPILLLLGSYAIFGTIAGILGIRVGKKVLKSSESAEYDTANSLEKKKNQNENFEHSLFWLFLNIAFIITGLILFSKTNWYIWTPTIIVIATIWIIRYRRALRKISNPKFWILFVFITLVTVFVFTRLQSGENVLVKGLIAGVQMNLRAVLMVLGFSVLAVELYNPIVRDFFRKSSFRQLPAALELSAESLPLFVSSIPHFKTAIRQPISIFSRVILLANKRLEEIKSEINRTPQVIIIAGEKNEGKTTFIKNILSEIKENGIKTGGIISEKIFENEKLIGYNIIDIETSKNNAFLRKGDFDNCDKIKKYSILKSGLEFGNDSLIKAAENNSLLIIDEVGQLELLNKGWHQSILEILKSDVKTIIITVRTEFIETIKEKYSLDTNLNLKVSENSPKEILKLLNNTSSL
jgi:nucleoside-triphosphatase THEP1